MTAEFDKVPNLIFVPPAGKVRIQDSSLNVNIRNTGSNFLIAGNRKSKDDGFMRDVKTYFANYLVFKGIVYTTESDNPSSVKEGHKVLIITDDGNEEFALKSLTTGFERTTFFDGERYTIESFLGDLDFLYVAGVLIRATNSTESQK